jgi:putative membrane protein
MHISTKIFVILAGLLHVVIFAMESLFFMNEKVYTRFGLFTVEHAQIVQAFAYNQGWYNLFLAIAALMGVFFAKKMNPNVGNTLSLYACFSMLAAALVLITSSPEMARAAITQGLFPCIAIVTFFALRNKAESS